MKYLFIKSLIILVTAVTVFLFAVSCTSSSDNSSSSSSSSTGTSDETTTTGTTVDNQSSVSTPANFATILSETISPALSPTLKSSVANLDRVLLKYSSSYIHLDNSSYAVGINSSISTYNDVFLKTFLLVEKGYE